MIIRYNVAEFSPGQNVIIQANYVNYSTLYEKLSENYAESKKTWCPQIFSTVTYLRGFDD